MDENRFDVWETVGRYRWQVLFLLIGLILLVAGLVVSAGMLFGDPKVEVVKSGALSVDSVDGELVVEVVGEVMEAGVYRLPIGSRVQDLLIVAGGVGIGADREWMEKSLNRAAKLVDGQKVYIPDKTQSANVKSQNDSSGLSGVHTGNLVNINTASFAELDSLPGIGQKYGQSIIEQRPYSSINELVERGVLPSGTFEKISDKISVY